MAVADSRVIHAVLIKLLAARVDTDSLVVDVVSVFSEIEVGTKVLAFFSERIIA